MNREVTVSLPDGDALPELARSAVKGVLSNLSRPSYRAGLGSSLLFTVFLAKNHVRPTIAIPLAVMLGATVEKLYEMAEDVHETALAQRTYLERLTGEAGDL